MKMKYKDAISVLTDNRVFQRSEIRTAMEVAIIAMNELEEYKKLGTYNELREAKMSREKAKKLLGEYENKALEKNIKKY